MTEKAIQKNIRETAEEIEKWAWDTERLVEDISTVLPETGEAEAEALQSVMKYLNEVKETMTDLKKA